MSNFQDIPKIKWKQYKIIKEPLNMMLKRRIHIKLKCIIEHIKWENNHMTYRLS